MHIYIACISALMYQRSSMIADISTFYVTVEFVELPVQCCDVFFEIDTLVPHDVYKSRILPSSFEMVKDQS